MNYVGNAADADESEFIVHSSVFTNRMNFAGHDLESPCFLLVLEL